MPFEVMEVANIYTLLQIGLNYSDINEIPCDIADSLVLLHKEIKDYEADEIKKESKKMKRK